MKVDFLVELYKNFTFGSTIYFVSLSLNQIFRIFASEIGEEETP